MVSVTKLEFGQEAEGVMNEQNIIIGQLLDVVNQDLSSRPVPSTSSSGPAGATSVSAYIMYV